MIRTIDMGFLIFTRQAWSYSTMSWVESMVYVVPRWIRWMIIANGMENKKGILRISVLSGF